MDPTAPGPGAFKTTEIITVLCISYDYDASRPPPTHFKTMKKMLTVLYISYDSVANRPPPTDFQNHENDDSLSKP